MSRNGIWIGTVLMALNAVSSNAAPGDHMWSEGWSVSGAGIGMDGAGSVVSAGTFGGSADFGGGTLSSETGFDVFVAKLSNTGTHVWSGAYPPTFFVDVTAVAASPSGKTYVAGTLPKGGTIDFGGGPLGGNFGDCWAVGFDPSGNHMWSDSYGRGVISSIDATDSEVGFAARSVETLNFGGSDLGTSGDAQAIAVLLTDQGDHIWSQEYGDGEFQAGLEVGLLASGELILLADVRGTADFGGGALSGDSDGEYALARFDGAGAHVWSRINSGDFGFSEDMDVTSSGSIAITGEFTGTADFGSGTLVSAGADVFVARFDSSGNPVWSEAYGGNDAESGTGIAFDPSNGLVVVGRYADPVDFGGGALPYVASADAFVLSLDTGGAHQWSKGFGSSSYESRSDVEVGQNGAPILDLQGGTDLDFGGGPIAGSYYIAKLEGADTPPPVSTPEAGGLVGMGLSVSPNPFSTQATIRLAGSADFAALGDAPLSLSVFDAAGRQVKRFTGVTASSLQREIEWDGRNDAGLPVVPGVYFVRLETAETSAMWRVVRIG